MKALRWVRQHSRSLVAALLTVVSLPALAGWFGSSRVSSPIEIDDSAYVQMVGQGPRPSMKGIDQITKVSLSADKTILRFNLSRRRFNGFTDQYEHGLLTPTIDGLQIEVSYDRVTGLMSYQTVSQTLDTTAAIRTANGPMVLNTESVELLQPVDPVIPAFLDAVIDHLDLLADAYRKPADCSVADRVKQALPLEAFFAAMPANKVLYTRNLQVPDGCERVWKQVQWAVNSVFELIAPISTSNNSGMSASCMNYTGCGRATSEDQAFFEGSPIGRLDPGMSAKMKVIARTNEFRPINYDLVALAAGFEMDSRSQALLVKKKMNSTFADQSHGGSVLGVRYDPLPTLWDSEDGLKHLRSEKMKAYVRTM